MAFRVYIVPAQGSGVFGDPRRPKYFDGKRWAGMDYGFQSVFLVAADLSIADDAAITANSDVTAAPFNLDGNPSAGGVTAAQNALEALRIPAGWINTSLTWRQIVRTVAGLFQYMQRLHVVFGNVQLLNGTTRTLDTAIGDLSVSTRQALNDAAQSLGYDTAGITLGTTIRAALKNLADQWGTRPFRLNEFVF